jgi:hypothetical protein
MFLKDVSYLDTLYTELISRSDITFLKQKTVTDLLDLYTILTELDSLVYISDTLIRSIPNEGKQNIYDMWVSLIGVCKLLDLEKLRYKDTQEQIRFRKIHWKIINKFGIETTKRYHKNFVFKYNIEFLRPKYNEFFPAHYDWTKHIYNNKKNPLFKDLLTNFDMKSYSNAVGIWHQIEDHYKIYQSNSPGLSYEITWPPRKEVGIELFEKTYNLPNNFRDFVDNNIKEYLNSFKNNSFSVTILFDYKRPKIKTLKLKELIETNKMICEQVAKFVKISNDRAVEIMKKLIFIPVYVDNIEVLPFTAKVLNDYISILPIINNKIEIETYTFAIAQVFGEELFKTESNFDTNKSLIFGFQELVSLYFNDKINIKNTNTKELSFLDCVCYQIIMSIFMGQVLSMISKSRVDDILDYIQELENELNCENLDIIILEHLSRFDIHDFILQSKRHYIKSKIDNKVGKMSLESLISEFI